jgi:hypothetical protein
MTLDSNGTDHKIRFEHIDAPEVNPSQFYGGISRDKLKGRLPFGEDVEVDVQPKKDKYGRFIGVVWLLQPKRENINWWMVENGHAWHYKKYSPVPPNKKYADAETRARNAKIGLWAQPNPIPPWEFRTGVRPQQPGNTKKTYLPGTPINGANPNPILTNVHKRQLRLGLRKGVKLPAGMIPVTQGTPPPKPTGLTPTKQTKVNYYRPVFFQGSNKKPVQSISGRARRPR